MVQKCLTFFIVELNVGEATVYVSVTFTFASTFFTNSNEN